MIWRVEATKPFFKTDKPVFERVQQKKDYAPARALEWRTSRQNIHAINLAKNHLNHHGARPEPVEGFERFTLQSDYAKASSDGIRHSFSDGGQVQDERVLNKQEEIKNNTPHSKDRAFIIAYTTPDAKTLPSPITPQLPKNQKLYPKLTAHQLKEMTYTSKNDNPPSIAAAA